jgi:hypothetical protein
MDVCRSGRYVKYEIYLYFMLRAIIFETLYREARFLNVCFNYLTVPLVKIHSGIFTANYLANNCRIIIVHYIKNSLFRLDKFDSLSMPIILNHLI